MPKPSAVSLLASLLPLGSLVFLACTGGEPSNLTPEFVWSETDTLVSSSSEKIGHPTALALGPEGTFFVLDVLNGEVHHFGPGGEWLASLGGEGSGPGEFRRPSSMWIEGDTIWVLDQRNGRLQVLDLSGVPLASFPLPAEAYGGRARLGPGGRMLFPRWTNAISLVSLYDREGGLIREFGSPLEPSPEFLDMVAIRNEIVEGGVPGFFRNQSMPVLAPDGGVWLGLQADGGVRRYDRDGALLHETPLETEEYEGILQSFFERNRAEAQVPSFFSLRYFADAHQVGSEVWFLLNRDDDQEGVILSLSEDGEFLRKVFLPGVRGPRVFAVDEEGSRVLLGVPSAAAVLAVAVDPSFPSGPR